MPQRLQTVVACATFVLAADVAPAAAQAQRRQPAPLEQRASAAPGRILGIVCDEAGLAINGVNIVALGTTLASVQSDAGGRFSLRLPPGEYILRASREGYISSFREPVRVQTSTPIERNIILIRVGEIDRVVLASMTGNASRQPTGTSEPSPAGLRDHAHSELAWRLRHLTRSILRDGMASGTDVANGNRTAESFTGRGSLLDRALVTSANAATRFFTATDFNGSLNFLTTGTFTDLEGWRPEPWSRGVAYVSLGAPVGGFGDWTVRGAVNAGDLSSWVLAGEYRARPEMDHRVRVGMSYSVQGDLSAASTRRIVGVDTRSAGSVFGADRWRIRPGVEVEYGLRIDRHDYVALPDLVSPHAGARFQVAPRTRVAVSAAQHVVAPGANEFLPPNSSGVWLPPERTFSPLDRGSSLRAGRVRAYDVAVERDFGDAAVATTVSVRRFRQFSRHQVATLFGTRSRRGAGHYRVATPGDVAIDGWGVSVVRRVTRRVQAAVDYTVSAARWTEGAEFGVVSRTAPSVARAGTERLHDVIVHVDADIPESDTRVTLAYRGNSAFSRASRSEPLPAAGGRFDLEVRQALPYRPLRGSQLEVLFAIRNLFRDARAEGSLYDELLTTAPPLRLMGGVRVRF
jgi:hypothetical protein